MRRLFLAAAPLSILLLATACGGDDGGAETATPAVTDAGPTLDTNQQPQAPDKPLPTPRPVASDLPVLQVIAGGKPYLPTRADLNALPKISISAGGKNYEGVSLAAIAEKAGAPTTAVATIQGTRLDNLRLGAVRFGLSEIGPSTVFLVDEAGHVLLASTSIPQDQWLKDITGIALN